MKKRNGRNNLKKEKAVMIASSVLVLSALTVTGIYVRNGDKEEEDGGYTIDFSALENEEEAPLVEAEEIPAADNSDLDYDPSVTEAGSTTVESLYGKGIAENPAENAESGEEAQAEARKPDEAEIAEAAEMAEIAEAGITKDGLDEEETAETAEAEKEPEKKSEEVSAEAISAEIKPELSFSEADRLMMPLAGNILINYSADKSVYFPTLQQYKCNPALIIGAAVGEPVKAAEDGLVSRIYQDAVTGNTVVMELGGGYEVVYGQLDNITVSEGSYVAEGETFAQIAEPTRYYSVEGSNLYLKLTKDGIPENPIVE